MLLLAVLVKAQLEEEAKEAQRKLLGANALHRSDQFVIESFEHENREMKTALDRLTRLRVIHLKVALLEERTTKVEKLAMVATLRDLRAYGDLQEAHHAWQPLGEAE